MAHVWLGDDVVTNRRIAIKEPRQDPFDPDLTAEVLRRFRHEIEIYRLLAEARVPCVVQLIETVHVAPDADLLILDYADGGSLAKRIADFPHGLPVAQVVRVAVDICEALERFHQLPPCPVHRDIKPSNILLTREGRALLGDFGLAQLPGASGRSLMIAGPHPGTPLYMAPEQIKGQLYLSPSADIYALGCVLFEILTGRKYKREPEQVDLHQLRRDAPKHLRDAIRKALADNPLDRFRSASEMANMIANTQRHEKKWHLHLPGARISGVLDEHPGESTDRVETRVPFVWIKIPHGEFLMGSNPDLDRDYDTIEIPQCVVRLPAFEISRTPVTNEQYAIFVRNTRYRTPDHWMNGRIPIGKSEHPVVFVSWFDAMAFCLWAGVHLPTEAQWEKAARGVDSRIWPWGDLPPDNQRCNFAMEFGDTTPVTKYPKGESVYRVLDMIGNVLEWTSTTNQPYPYDPNDGREIANHEPGTFRVLRGGNYLRFRRHVRCASRVWYSPASRLNNVGFRVVANYGSRFV